MHQDLTALEVWDLRCWPTAPKGVGVKALDSNAQPLKAVQCYGVQGLQCRVQALHWQHAVHHNHGTYSRAAQPMHQETHTYTPIRVREKNPNFLRWCLIIKFMKTWIYSVFCRILCNFSVRIVFWFPNFHQILAIFHQFSGFWGKCWFHLKIKLNWVFKAMISIWWLFGFDLILIHFELNLI